VRTKVWWNNTCSDVKLESESFYDIIALVDFEVSIMLCWMMEKWKGLD
jgi:hypothetical protein